MGRCRGSPLGSHADRYDATAIGYWRALLADVPIEPDAAVLDVGCGTGHSTREVGRLASSGTVLGVDLSAKMLERARAAANAEGFSNVRFEQADAQVHPFPPAAFDLALSVFGAMFFVDPGAAFANIGRALRPGGELALLAWTGLERNEWVAAIREALSLGRALPTPPAGAPGPFGLADRAFTQRVLTDARFVDVRFEEVTEPIRFGDDADDAFSFVASFGITKGLTQNLDTAGKAAALEALRVTLVEHETEDGVLFGGSAWLIRARSRTGGQTDDPMPSDRTRS